MIRELRLLHLCFLLLCAGTTLMHAQSGTRTTVHGVVRDSLTGERLAYATIVLEGGSIGTRSDVDGNFFIDVTGQKATHLRVTYVGYEAKRIPITIGKRDDIVVKLTEASQRLGEVSIRPKKYRNKDNPAVDLIEEVFKHKDKNRRDGLPYYSFEQYDKMRFNLNGITKKYTRKWYFRPFRFIFKHLDTNQVTQKVSFPFYLRERDVRSYYRKDPKARKGILLGERQSGFYDETESSDDLGIDEEGVSSFLNSTFADIDIYEPTFLLFGTEFVGPLSGIAPNIYRFYIEDTVVIDGKKYADIFFAPRNKADLAFMGKMLVALDSTYAVMSVEMGLSHDINLNWVTDLHIEQTFARVGDRLLITDDAFTADFKILKNAQGRSLLVHKTTRYRQYDLTTPPPDSVFNNNVLLVRDTGLVTRRDTAWWEERRIAPLTRSEQYIEDMIDSIKAVPIFKVMNGVGQVVGTGYYRAGWFDFGRVSSFYSFNGIEGDRIRVGGRTNAKLYKPLQVGGYAAYGTMDRRWKYQVNAIYSLNGRIPRSFPQHSISVMHQNDLLIPGFALGGLAQDNFAVSFQRGVNNRMLWTRTHRVEYRKEFENRLSFTTVAQRKAIGSAGTLLFEQADESPDTKLYKNTFTTAEVGFFVRYAPNQLFYNGPSSRTPIPSKYPVMSLTARHGFKGLAGGEYNYWRVHAMIEKRFFVAPFGISDWTVTAGKIWGTVPYPLLEVHAANQSYFNDLYAYNLMNFMEFVSDRYATLTVQHNFNGLFLNRVPLLKKARLREVCSAKVLYGGLNNRNVPVNNPDLFFFPADAEGNTITGSLGRAPYVELSAGLANILGIWRVDYIWRLNYLDRPDVTSWGIRVMMSPGF
jgi:Family of unknown function (DUF5686)/CarboxypepD_reg-like domain